MHKLLILIVADNSDFRTSLVFVLEAEEFRVAVVETDDFDRLIEEALSADCVVIDYRLTGPDRLALLEDLRAAGVTIPSIVISSAVSPRLRQRITAAGAEWIEKPMLSDALTATVRRIAGPTDA